MKEQGTPVSSFLSSRYNTVIISKECSNKVSLHFHRERALFHVSHHPFLVNEFESPTLGNKLSLNSV